MFESARVATVVLMSAAGLMACSEPAPSAGGPGDASLDASSEAPDRSDAAPATLLDIHAHILPRDKEANTAYVDKLANVARGLGVQVVLGLHARHVPDRPPTYSTDHDAWTLEAVDRHPDVFVASLNGFDPSDAEAPEYVRKQLATGKYRLLGELDLRNRPKQTTTAANHPNMMAIYAHAETYGVAVLMHFEPCYGTECSKGDAELDEVLTTYSSTPFILAHGCLMQYVSRYSNLYCEYEVQTGELPTTHLDRVMMGTDIQNAELGVGFGPGKSVPYADVVTMQREKLAKLTESDARAVAIGTARKLGIVR